MAHAGGRCSKLDDPEDLASCDQMQEIMGVARQLPAGAVDMIAAGHTHQAMAQDVGGIPIVEAYANGRSFSRVDFNINRSSGAVVAKHYANGETRDDALVRARQRFGSEQG